MKNIIANILYVIGIVSYILASGVRDVANWLDIARPYFAIGTLAIAIGVTIYNINNIRRVTYPMFVCMNAWFFKNKIIMTKFTRSTYRLYKFHNMSFKKLFIYVQDLFDMMYM